MNEPGVGEAGKISSSEMICMLKHEWWAESHLSGSDLRDWQMAKVPRQEQIGVLKYEKQMSRSGKLVGGKWGCKGLEKPMKSWVSLKTIGRGLESVLNEMGHKRRTLSRTDMTWFISSKALFSLWAKNAFWLGARMESQRKDRSYLKQANHLGQSWPQ